MPSTTTYKRGDVVLVPFPFTDLSNAKQRPALVVSADAFNLHGIVAPDLKNSSPTAMPHVEIYTDGGCEPNLGAGWFGGALVHTTRTSGF